MGFRCDRLPFNDKRVRQAISKAIDRQVIADTVYSGQSWFNAGIVLPVADWGIADEELKRLYRRGFRGREATLSRGRYGRWVLLRTERQQPLADPFAIAELITAQLRDINVTVQIKLIDSAAFPAIVRTRAEYEAYLAAIVPNPAPTPTSFVPPQQGRPELHEVQRPEFGIESATGKRCYPGSRDPQANLAGHPAVHHRQLPQALDHHPGNRLGVAPPHSERRASRASSVGLGRLFFVARAAPRSGSCRTSEAETGAVRPAEDLLGQGKRDRVRKPGRRRPAWLVGHVRGPSAPRRRGARCLVLGDGDREARAQRLRGSGSRGRAEAQP